MALIGTIRKNSWILIVMIALGLGGFIVMDMTSAGGNTGGAGQFTLGQVDGQDIDYREFQNTQNVLYSGGGASVFDQRDYLWNYFVEKALVENEAEDLGLTVSSNELNELQFGSRMSPIIRQRFMNPNTGQVDITQLNNFRQAIQSNTLTPELRQMWYYQEKEVIKEQLQNKLNNIVSKGIYTPTWMAEMAHHQRNDKFSFEYVSIPFDEVSDAEVNLTDADLNKYVQENKALYEKDVETRKVNYVSFDVFPTSQDSADLWQNLVDLKSDFAAATDDSLFVETNYGTIDVVYFAPEDLDAEISGPIQDMELAEVYGPYQVNNEYKLVKLLDKKVVPDSAEVRHILRQVQTQEQLTAAITLIDSLKEMLETGAAEFDSLAIQYSQDAGSGAQGGDLGWNAENTNFVKPFKDMIFYQSEGDELNIVFSQFGVHLVQVTDRKYMDQEESYQIAFINSPIIPSEETQDLEYDRVTEVVTNNRDIESLQSAISAIPGMNIEESELLEANDAYLVEVGTNQTARDIVRWAFDKDTELGDVSPEVYINEDVINYYNNKYLIVSLAEIIEPGLAPLASIREDITPIVRNKKKGEILQGKISGSDLNAIASQFNSQVDSVTDVTFSASFIPGLGSEPKVLATALNMQINDVSEPIAGENGVYVIRITDRIEDVTDPNIANLRRQVSSSVKGSIPTTLVQSIKDKVKVKDNRYTFY